jgi:hypothetical protein
VLNFAAHAASNDDREFARGAHFFELGDELVFARAVAIQGVAIECDIADARVKRSAVRVYLHSQSLLSELVRIA